MADEQEGVPILETVEYPPGFLGMTPTSDDDRPVHATKFGIHRVMTKAEALERLKRPCNPEVWQQLTNYGTALHIAGYSKEALAYTAQAAKVYPCALTLLNLAVVLEAYGRFDESLELARKAVEFDNGDQFAGLLWAQGLLRQKRWKEAWPAFEWYCWGKIWEGFKEFLPQWEGEPLDGKTILVLQGGGFGDNMMFFRWLGELKRMGARVVYACPDSMVPLLEGHPWCDALVPTHESPETNMLPEVDIDVIKNGVRMYDYFIPVMALPSRFNATAETIPWDGPYIETAEKADLKRGVKPLVGFCWKAGEVLDPRRQRSLNREQAEKLLSVKEVDWVSLQVMATDSTGKTSAPLENNGRFIEVPIKNWRDTASIINSLDLVVTIDTGIMHLAGAMNKPCWVLLSSLSDWKFFMDGDGDPFYPSVKLFRNGKGVTGLDNSLAAVMMKLKETYSDF